MSYSYKLKDNSLIVKLNGELDHCVAEQLRYKIDVLIDQNRFDNFVFDLSDLNFMDSTGIGLIIGRYKKMKEQNINVSIINPDDNVDKILKMSGIYKLIPCFEVKNV